MSTFESLKAAGIIFHSDPTPTFLVPSIFHCSTGYSIKVFLDRSAESHAPARSSWRINEENERSMNKLFNSSTDLGPCPIGTNTRERGHAAMERELEC